MTEELKIIISAEIDKLREELNKGKKETEKFGKEGESNFKKFSEAAKKVGNAVKQGMKVAIAAFTAAAAAMVGLSEATAEYRANQAKLTTAFEAAGAGAREAKAVYSDLYRVLGDDGKATEAAAHLAKLTTNEKELAEWTNICQGVYATFGESLPIEGLTEAANETAKVGQVTGTLADALNWAGISEDAFNESLAACNNEAEREALIRQTLNGIYDDAAKKYEKNAAEVLAANEAQAKMTDGLAALGAAVTPVVTLFKSGLGDTLQELVPHFEMVSKGFQDMIGGISGGKTEIQVGVSRIIDTILEKISNLLPTVLTVGGDIITSLIKGFVNSLPNLTSTLQTQLPQIVKTIMSLIPQITGALLGALPDLLQTVFDIVIEIINGLAEALPQILEQIVALIPQIINTIIENIPLLLEAAINFLMAIVDAIPQIIPPLIEQLPTIIDSIITCLLQNLPTLIDGAIKLLMGLVNAIDKIIPPLVAAIPKIIVSIVGALIAAIPDLLEGAGKAFMAIVEALGTTIGTAIKAIEEFLKSIGEIFGKIKDKIAEKLGEAKDKALDIFNNIRSGISEKVNAVKEKVSGVFTDIKSSITEKISAAKNSVLTIFDRIREGISEKIENAKTKVKNVIDKIKGFFDFKWELPKLKMPHISITGQFSISPPSVPKFSISWHALGGIFDKPTLFNFGGGLHGLGENGAEAVVPLENNLGWLDKLASMLSDRMGGTTPIVLTVDGKVFAETAISTINQQTKQTGKLALNVL